jgi:hypothetical protein
MAIDLLEGANHILDRFLNTILDAYRDGEIDQSRQRRDC